MGGPCSSQFPLEMQLAVLSLAVEDSEIVQAAVASGYGAWEQVHELLVGAGWPERRVDAALDTAIDRQLICEHELGRFRVVEWTR